MASKLLKARKSATRTKARTRTRTKAHARRQEPVRRTKRWSQKVTQESNALDLERGVFTRGSSHAIALSLKRSALKSALSMLTFYVNRAGRGLSAARRRTLDRAKRELRAVFGKGTGAT
jgi:Protein of unknown function (DUF3175)